MPVREIASFVNSSRAILSTVLHRSGKILYSSVETLQPGPIYILGLNPGGDPDYADDSHYTLEEALQRLPDKHDNDFLDECWQACQIPGGRPLQRRTQWLCRQLGHEPANVCASNLIFLRSRGSSGSGYPQSADLCWPVHEHILQLVRPRLILVLGSEVYEYVGTRLAGPGFKTVEIRASGHGGWVCRRAEVLMPYGGANLIQVPHLSRYAINNHLEVAEWLRESL
jgi:hypothetical protein